VSMRRREKKKREREKENDLGLSVELDDTSGNHFVVEIISFTGSLSDTSEDRVTSVHLGNVIDELSHQHSLSDTGTSEKSDLSSLGVRSKKIDHLNSGFKNLGFGRLVAEAGGIGVDGGGLLGLDGSSLVDRLSNDVHDASEGFGSDGNLDGASGVLDLLATNQSFGSVHSNGAHGVLSKCMGMKEEERNN